MSNASAAGIYFPPTTAFPIPRDDDGPAREKRAPRRRPAADVNKSKRSSAPAEPGDEGAEAGWMAGLSNRLSAYSLADEDAEPEGETGAGDASDDTTEA
jgi:hypothetical protein